MASGLPVVATHSGAIDEVVPAWNPLVDEGDVTGLARGLATLVGPGGAGIGARNRADALARFDLEGQADRLRQVLGAFSTTAP